MVSGRQFLVELLRAFCVLGLLFLNFAHAPAVAAGDDGVLCGPTSATDGHPANHDDPCPACRLADAGCVLPPAQPAVVPPASAAVHYSAAAGVAHDLRAIALFNARGPPSA